jgi:hypothetical protein
MELRPLEVRDGNVVELLSKDEYITCLGVSVTGFITKATLQNHQNENEIV